MSARALPQLPGRLAGKVALITGGGLGIGRACALLFAREGADIAIFDRSPADAAETVRLVRERGRRAEALLGDISQVEDCRSAVSGAAQALGRVDILVNSAGVGAQASWEMDEAEWDRVIDINLKGTFFCSQAAALHMREHGGGRIVNLASIEGQVVVRSGTVCQPHYNASKGGVIMVTKAMALDLAPLGIRVNAIAPGVINTTIAGGLWDREPERRRRIEARVPMGALGEAEDIAQAALYLASDESRYVNGAVLVVDGGHTVW